jgi:hypothetical protein
VNVNDLFYGIHANFVASFVHIFVISLLPVQLYEILLIEVGFGSFVHEI